MNPIEYEGKLWVTPKEFANGRERTAHQVYDAIKNGNGTRQLESAEIAGRIMVALDELDQYPFTKVEEVEFRMRDMKREYENRLAALELTVRNLRKDNTNLTRRLKDLKAKE